MDNVDYVGFLEGENPDNNGLTIDKILRFNRWQLEFVHNYIQRIFPLNEKSKFDKIRPITEEEIQRIRESNLARDNVSQAYKKMLRFWKLDDVHFNSNSWELNIYRHWNNENNHNYWRMTRVLKSLKLLEMKSEYSDFCKRLELLIKNKVNYKYHISNETMREWLAVMIDDFGEYCNICSELKIADCTIIKWNKENVLGKKARK